MDPALQKEIATVNKFRAINEAILGGDSPIQQFYRGSTVFVTGSTGFLGKQLVEKLLRSCDVKRIYLLIREKKGETVQERMVAETAGAVFDEVRKMKPDFSKKLVPIKGDIAELRVGLSDEDWTTITNEVNVIIHAAATIKFTEPLKSATLINVRGTREMLMVGKACTKLESYVHISTAFSYATRSRFRKEVLETFYKSPVPPEAMIQMAECVDENWLDDITPGLIQDWPNTYAFTKAISEESVRMLGADMPLCIIRPGLVTGSYREPAPGWTDSSQVLGPTGFILGGGLGVLHTVLCQDDLDVHFVPIDFVNNAVISGGWATAKNFADGDKETKIYAVTCARNKVNLRILLDILSKLTDKYSFPMAVWYVFMVFANNKYLYFALNWFFHKIPAYIGDAICWMIGKPTRFVKLVTRVDSLNEVLCYFSLNEWHLSDNNLVELQSSLSPIDQIIYHSDVKTVDWQEYMICSVLGIRKYILKDNLQGTDVALKKQFWFRIAHYVFSGIYLFVLYKIFSTMFWILSNVINIFTN